MDERSNCNWFEVYRCSRLKDFVRPGRPKPIPAPASSPRGSHQLFVAVYGLWQSANGHGKMLDYRRLSDRLLQLTAGKVDDGLRLQAHHSAWPTCKNAGEPAAAREHCEAGRRLYDPERTALTACFTVGTTLAFAPATLARPSIGYSVIPTKAW